LKKYKYLIIFLSVALLLTNAWWVFCLLDAGITQTYMGKNIEDHAKALTQTMKLLPVVSRPGTLRKEILAAARVSSKPDDDIEKDGFIWVENIGLKFDAHEKLVAVEKAWE
jgi:hypothetical protein